MIELESVTVQYGSTTALRDVTAMVKPGEWVGLIGPNGAGKTTMLRAVANLVELQGTVRIQEQTVKGMARRHMAALVAYVPQNPVIPADISVAAYVLLGRTPHLGYFRFETARDHEVCDELLESLRLSAMADRPLQSLSGGELQRVVLARALAQEATVLLLDEPTSALDLGRRVDVLELVDELRHEHGLTVLSAMHDLTLAAQFADRLMLLAGGELVDAGSPEEVLDESCLSRHFGGSVRVLRTEDNELIVVPRRDGARQEGR